MEITRSGSKPSGKGPAEYFIGMVRVDPLFQVPETSTRERRKRHIRTWHAYRMAHPSSRADPNRHSRLRSGTARRRSARGGPSRRRDLVLAG